MLLKSRIALATLLLNITNSYSTFCFKFINKLLKTKYSLLAQVFGFVTYSIFKMLYQTIKLLIPEGYEIERRKSKRVKTCK